MKNSFFKFVVRASLGKNAEQRGVFPGQPIHLFVKISGKAVFESMATLSNAVGSGQNFIDRRLRNDDMLCIKKSDQVVVYALKV